MTTTTNTVTLHVQHGEVITDDALNFAAPLPAGIYEFGTPTAPGSGVGPFTATIPPGLLGFTIWRDMGASTHGRITVMDANTLTFTIPALSGDDQTAGGRTDIICGGHHWIASGAPLGTVVPEMSACYQLFAGTSGAGLVVPSFSPNTPTAWGGAGTGPGGPSIPLWRVNTTYVGGVTTVSIIAYPPYDNRITNLGPTYSEVVAARGAYVDLPTRLNNPSIPAGGLKWVDSVTGHIYTLTIVSGVLTLTY